jgi:acyl dehydratase
MSIHEKRYYEDLAIGQEFVSQARTITEADGVMWSALTADWTPLHVDEEFAKTTPFGTRIPPGLMSQAITHGLLSRLEDTQRIASVAFLQMTVRYTGTVRFGDTLHGTLRVKDKRLTSKGDKGLVTYQCSTINQRGEIVQDGEWLIMVACRPTT